MLQRRVDPVDGLRVAVAPQPVLAQRGAQLERRFGVVPLDRPSERGAEVVELGVEPGEVLAARSGPQSARVGAVALGRAPGSSGSGARGPPRGPRPPRSARRRTRGSSPASPAGSAAGCRRRTSRLLATSRSSVSMSAPVIVSAASTVAPPANTAKRAKHACSSSLSRLVAPVDRRAQRLLAGGRVARPGAESRRARPAGASAISPGESSPQRAAASSIASGSPSTRRQISATAFGVAVARARSPGRALARARRTAPRRPRRPARPGPLRAPAARAAARDSSCSACTASGSRLVASTVTAGHAPQQAADERRGAPAGARSCRRSAAGAWRRGSARPPDRPTRPRAG